ncbi:succinyl-diaminopimelate desuccinylase [Parelusimicrobium proximum]|uniref:M20 family metallo-hydrolase n=1 Tax=Parelusimicrobium proximum TaxID=3228953 RepID=UPI003D16CCF2
MKSILKKIDGYKNYVIELQTGMISHEAIAPESGGSGELKKAKFLESELKKLKFDEIKRIDAKDKKADGGVRPNIIAKYYGKDKSKTLWMMAHMDTVPVGDIKMWKTDPFKAVVKGDKIYGRGSEDNNQGAVSAFLAVRAVMESGQRPPINVALLLVSDEELGSEYGIDFLVKKHRNIFGKQDMVLAPDAGDAKGEQVEVAEKNLLWLKITTTGKEAHGSRPNSGINAGKAAAYLITALDQALYKKFAKKDKMFEPNISTFEPTKKESNVLNINNIPGTDVFYMDCRVLPLYKSADVLKEVNRVAKEIEKKTKAKIKVEALRNEGSIPTDPKHQLVTTYIKGLKEICKNKPRPVGIGGGTVAAYLRNIGIPVVVSSTLLDTLHAPNEYSSIKNTITDAKVMAYVLMNLK